MTKKTRTKRLRIKKFVVLQRFIDRETTQLYGVGDGYKPTSADRANELVKGGYIGPVVEKPDPPVE